MKFSVRSSLKQSCRRGSISFSASEAANAKTQTFETPLCILSTSRSCVPHLTLDTLANLLEHFNEGSVNEAIGCPLQLYANDFIAFSKKSGSIEREGGVRGFAQLKGYPIFMSMCRKDLIAKDNGEKYCSFKTKGGSDRITITDFTDLSSRMKPNVVIPLFDLPLEQQDLKSTLRTTASNENANKIIGSKRIKKSIDRNMRFLDAVIACSKNASVFGVIPCYPMEQFTSETLVGLEKRKNEISGYFITFDENERDELVLQNAIESVVTKLQSTFHDAPRMISSSNGSPEFILEMWKRGIDIFESNWLHERTEAFQAIDFDFEKPKTSFLELSDEKLFALDPSPILSSCSCYACKNHSRAYIHHLIQTNEMLGLVLIQM